MEPSANIQCFHRIISFQAHKNCHQYSAICEQQCQKAHKTNTDISLISVDAVQDQFKLIKDLLFSQTKKIIDPVNQIYTEIIQELQKQQTEQMRLLEKQIFSKLMKNVSEHKAVMEKIDNKKFAKIKCHELMCFIEASNFEQKIKDTSLNEIRDKYLGPAQLLKKKFESLNIEIGEIKLTNKSRQNNETHLSKGEEESIESEQEQQQTFLSKAVIHQPKSSISSNEQGKHLSLLRDSPKNNLEQRMKALERDNKNLLNKCEKHKYQIQVLIADKKNLERQLAKRIKGDKINKRTTQLTQRTWNIYKIVTKKIKKGSKPPQEKDCCEIEIQNIENEENRHTFSNLFESRARQEASKITNLDSQIINQKEANISNCFNQSMIQQVPIAQPEQIAPPPPQTFKNTSTNPQSPNKRQSISGPLAILNVGNQIQEVIEQNISDESSDFITYIQKKKLI